MSVRIEVLYDPHDTPPLKLNIPVGTNPSLIICLFSQVITGLSQATIAGDASSLILPVQALPKMPT